MSAKLVNHNLTLSEYQRLAKRTDQNSGKGLQGLDFLLLGLFGEVGTLLSALKKRRRDKKSFSGFDEAILEEFGDSLWYFTNIASRASLDLSVLAHQVTLELSTWDSTSDNADLTFGSLQANANKNGSNESVEFESALIGLAGKVGLLLNDFHLGRITNSRDALSANLVEVFRAFISAANIADVDLAQVGQENIRKIESRWPQRKEYPPLFDERFGSLERFPREFEIQIFEESINGKLYVIQQCHGLNIGSKLTDNRMEDDDYRFHDVFHLSYLAVLGWSPVLRALFKLKRKSISKVDEAQDGARAILIEEGLSTLIFHRAGKLNYFEGITSLDYSLLKLIPEFVSGFEVDVCPLWQWEKAILDGFTVFRRLQKARRGTIVVNLNNREISFKELL